MTPPRWNSKNADRVRAELVRRVEEENSPAPVKAPSFWSAQQRGGTVRLAAAVVIALALIVPVSLYAFALAGRPHPAGGSSTTVLSPTPDLTPTTTPESTAPGRAVTSSTCTLGQLTLSEPGPGGATTGDWVQLITVHNHGTACTLPATAFALAGRIAQGGGTSRAGGFSLVAGSTTLLSVLTDIGCGNGSGNTSTLGPNAKPVIVRLGGDTAAGLNERLPVVSCARLVVDRVN